MVLSEPVRKEVTTWDHFFSSSSTALACWAS